MLPEFGEKYEIIDSQSSVKHKRKITMKITPIQVIVKHKTKTKKNTLKASRKK